MIRGDTVEWLHDGQARSYRFEPRPCGVENSRTLERNEFARLYRLNNVIWGCMLDSERRTRLGAQVVLETDYKSYFQTGRFIHLAGHLASGALAWVDFNFDSLGRQPVEVRKWDADGEAIVLDTAARDYGAAGDDEIDPASLQLSPDATSISWMHGGEQRTATLRPG